MVDPNDNPLDYFSSNAAAEPVLSETEPDQLAAPLPVVPVEFDCLLTETTDHAAARAILTALKARQIATFEIDDHAPAHRKMMIYIAATHQPEAAAIASAIFARREKFKSFPKPEPLPETPSTGRGLGGTFGF